MSASSTRPLVRVAAIGAAALVLAATAGLAASRIAPIRSVAARTFVTPAQALCAMREAVEGRPGANVGLGMVGRDQVEVIGRFDDASGRVVWLSGVTARNGGTGAGMTAIGPLRARIALDVYGRWVVGVSGGSDAAGDFGLASLQGPIAAALDGVAPHRGPTAQSYSSITEDRADAPTPVPVPPLSRCVK